MSDRATNEEGTSHWNLTFSLLPILLSTATLAKLEGIANAQGCAIQVTVLPKKTEAGNPDFRVWDGSYQVSRRICCSWLNGFIRGLA